MAHCTAHGPSSTFSDTRSPFANLTEIQSLIFAEFLLGYLCRKSRTLGNNQGHTLPLLLSIRFLFALSWLCTRSLFALYSLSIRCFLTLRRDIKGWFRALESKTHSPSLFPRKLARRMEHFADNRSFPIFEVTDYREEFWKLRPYSLSLRTSLSD